MNNMLEIKGITKTYNAGKPNQIEVLRGIDLTIARGEVVALTAPSGAGKSTLLHIAGLLDVPDAGTVTIAGQDMTGLGDRRRTAMRRAGVGFIYQFHHLLPEFTALENVVLPQLADEPTGNLDPTTSDLVFDVLMELVRDEGLSALIATHNHELADKMDRVVKLDAGQVVPA